MQETPGTTCRPSPTEAALQRFTLGCSIFADNRNRRSLQNPPTAYCSMLHAGVKTSLGSSLKGGGLEQSSFRMYLRRVKPAIIEIHCSWVVDKADPLRCVQYLCTIPIVRYKQLNGRHGSLKSKEERPRVSNCKRSQRRSLRDGGRFSSAKNIASFRVGC
jgi:hypothetical protein